MTKKIMNRRLYRGSVDTVRHRPRRPVGTHRPTTRDSGQATAELAVAIPSLVLVLVLAIWVVSAVSVQAQCAEAARVGARAAARGETDDIVRSWSRRIVPRNAETSVTHGRDVVVVQVRCGVRATGILTGVVPAIDITMSSTAPLESAENIGSIRTDSTS